MSKPTGPRRTKTQRAADREKAAQLDRLGFSQRQIAAKLGVSVGQVNADLAAVRAEYLDRANTNAGEKIGEILESMRDIRRQAWAAWQKSCEDFERVTERVGGKDGPITTTTREGRVPDARHLDTILDTLAQERALLGLDQEAPLLFLSVQHVLRASRLFMEAVGRVVKDPAKLAEIKRTALSLMPLPPDYHSDPPAAAPEPAPPNVSGQALSLAPAEPPPLEPDPDPEQAAGTDIGEEDV